MMSSETLDRLTNPTVGLSPEQLSLFDDFVLAFEKTWSPNCLAAQFALAASHAQPLARALMTELASIDMERQWEAGRRPSAEDYLGQFSQLATSDDAATALVIAECQARIGIGEPVDWESVTSHHPQVTEELQACLVAKAKPTTIRSADVDTCPQPAPLPASALATRIDGLSGQFGRYRIEQELGRGGMGIVYRAYDTELDRQVALKTPNHEISPNQEADFVVCLYEEARAAAKLVDHPHICSVYDVGQIDGIHFITMAYVPGQSLAEYLKSSGPIDQREAVELVAQIAKALQVAHDKGVVHRDLKPANIMLNQQREPVITDFGLAERVGKTASPGAQGAVGGTPAYMSPEQAGGNPEINALTDIYSLGVVLYEMLTGRRPRHGSAETLAKADEATPTRWPSELRVGIGKEVDTICQKMMALQPDSRYQSMSAVSAALEGVRSQVRPNLLANARSVRGGANKRATFIRGAAACSLLLLFAVVVTLSRRHGEVRFEFHDENIRVEIDQDQITIADIGKSKRLKPGKHSLTIRVADLKVPVGREFSFSDELYQGSYRAVVTLDDAVIAADHFDVRRGKKHVLRVKLVQVQDIDKSIATDVTPLDRLRRQDISDEHLRIAGHGKAASAPPPLVAVFGNSNWMHWHRIHRCSVAFGPDGKRIASGSWDASVVVWDIATGRAEEIYTNGTVGITALIWHPTESVVIVGTADGRLFAIDLVDGQWRPLKMRHSDLGEVDSIAISPDGEFLVSTATSTCCWYSLRAEKLIREVKHKLVRSVAISPDGKTIATAGGDSVVRFWDRASGKTVHEFGGERRDLYNAIAFTPDGSGVVVGLCNSSRKYKGLVRLLDRDGDSWSRLLSSPGGFAWSVKFSPSGEHFAEARESGEVHLWNVADWERRQTLATTNFPTNIENGKRTVAFSRDSERMASGGADNGIHVWQIPEEGPIAEPIAKPVFGRMQSVTLHPMAGRVAAAGDQGTFRIWTLPGGRGCKLVRAHRGPIRSLVYSPDGKMLASAGDDGQVRFWDGATGAPDRAGKSVNSKSTATVMGLAFDPRGPYVASTRFDGSVTCWNYRTGEERFSVPPPPIENGLVIDFSPNGDRLAHAGVVHRDGKQTGILYVRDARDGSMRLTVPLNNPVRSVAFGPKNRYLAVVSTAHYLMDSLIPDLNSVCTLTLMNASTGELVWSQSLAVTGVTFSNDGRSLLLAGFDGTVKIMDIASRSVRSMAIGPPHGVIIQAIMGPHDRHVITANRNGTVYVVRIDDTP